MQPRRRFWLDLALRKPIDLASIDRWLASTLGIEVVGNGENASGPADGAAVAAFARRGLSLVREILQQGGIPVFDEGRVLHVERSSKAGHDWRVGLAVADVELIDPHAYITAIDAAFFVLGRVMGRPLTPAGVAGFYEALEKRAIGHLRRIFFRGKSTIPILREAHLLGIPFTHTGGGVYVLGWGARSRMLDRSISDRDAAIGAYLAQNKLWSANRLRMAGLPAPEHRVVRSLPEALKCAHRLGWPVVVKPVDRDRGEGVTVGVSDDNRLGDAFESAKRLSLSGNVLVERQVSGVCHRLFIVGGTLLYAFKRRPKSVRGDGCSTVGTLIARANEDELRKPPWHRTEPFWSDEAALEAMAASGHTLDSVPGAGDWVPLRQIESTRWGGCNEDLTRSVHPDNVELAVRAAQLFGLDVVGVDVITPDLGSPWHATGAIINEVNFAPQLGRDALSRSYIPAYLERIVPAGGRIPVEAWIGGEQAMAAARTRQRELVDSGVQCFVTSHDHSVGADSREIHFTYAGLSVRCRALLANPQVDAIILVIATNELLHIALPVDRIERVEHVDGPMFDWKDPGRNLVMQETAQIRENLERLREASASESQNRY